MSRFETNAMSSDEEEDPPILTDQRKRGWSSGTALVFREQRGVDSVTLNEDTQTVQVTLDPRALDRVKSAKAEHKLTLIRLSWEDLVPSSVHYYVCEIGLLEDNTDLPSRIIEGLVADAYQSLRYLAEEFCKQFQAKITRVQCNPLALELAHPSSDGFDELKSCLGAIEDHLVDICTRCVGRKVPLNVTLRLGEERGDYDDMEFTLTIYGSDTESDDFHDPQRKALSPREQHSREEETFNRLQVIEGELQSQREHLIARFDEQEANNKHQEAILTSLTENVIKILQKHEELLQADRSNQISYQQDVRPKIRIPKATESLNKIDPRIGRETSANRLSQTQINQFDKTPENRNFPPMNQKFSSSSPNLNRDINVITSRPMSRGLVDMSPIPHQSGRREGNDQEQPGQISQTLQPKVSKQLTNEQRFESVKENDLFPNSLEVDMSRSIDLMKGSLPQTGPAKAPSGQTSTSNPTLVLRKEGMGGVRHEEKENVSLKQVSVQSNEQDTSSRQLPKGQGPQQFVGWSSQDEDLNLRTMKLEMPSSPVSDDVSSRREEFQSNSLRIERQSEDMKGEDRCMSLPVSTSQVKIKEGNLDKRNKPQTTMDVKDEKQIEKAKEKPEQEQKEQARAATPTLSLRSDHIGLGRARHFLDQHGVKGSYPGVKRMIQTMEAAMRGEDELPPKTKGLNTVLCLDTSSDNGQEGFKLMKEAVLEYLEGIEDIAAKFETEENIAVVSFGGQSRIVHHLSNDYTSIRTAVETLECGGKASLFEALLVCLCEINERASPTTIGETTYHPRIIIATGGNTVDDIEEGGLDHDTIENNSKDRVVKLLDDFAVPKGDAKLPQPLVWMPIPTQRGDRGFVEFLSEMENCSLCECKDMKELCKYQRTQEILETSYSQIKDSVVLQDNTVSVRDISAIVDSIGGEWEKNDKDEIVSNLQRRLNSTLSRTKVNPKTVSSDFNNVVELDDPELPRLGDRVVRGKDWPGGEADGRGAGTVVNHIDGQQSERKIIWVLWDNGECKKYKYGYQGAHDVKVTTDSPRSTNSEMIIEIGCEVTRGRDWMTVYENQDGGAGGVGVVIRKDDRGNVKVRWQRNGKMNDYRYGIGNKIDLRMRDPAESLLTHTSSGQSSPNTSSMAREKDTKDVSSDETVWVWQRRSEEQGWVLYEEASNAKLEKEYKRRKDGSCVLQRNGARVSFKLNSEKKVDGDSKTDVRRICMSEKDLAAMRGTASNT